jgi:ubiquitin-conjugating enzyme E2 M
MEPDEGYYAAGRYGFTIAINQNFPHDPPKVKCRHKLYHPNIDKAGNVCLNILREDWKPVLNIHSVIVGLYVRAPPHLRTTQTDDCQFLLLEPNASDPLNKEAAEELRHHKDAFRRNSRAACMGGYVHGEKYDRVYKSAGGRVPQ